MITRTIRSHESQPSEQWRHELTSYVNRYQKELEEIARREMADWIDAELSIKPWR